MGRWQEAPHEGDEPPGRGCDDPETVRRAQHDSAAFTVLFECFWAIVLRYCYGRLRSWPDAEDAAQAAFVKATLHLPHFEPRESGGGFRSWLLRVAHNETISLMRTVVRRASVPFPEAELVDPAAGPAEIAEEIALNDWLADLCARLPKDQRAVMQLRFAGLQTREIARVLDKSEAAVRKATERATARLQLFVDVNAEVRRG